MGVLAVLVSVLAFVAFLSYLTQQLSSKRSQKPDSSILSKPTKMAALPKHEGPWTLGALRKFDGSTSETPIYICIRDIIYDITSHPSGRELYSAPSGYSVMAGRDASVMLAKMDLKIGFEHNLTVSDLDEEELKVLEDWEKKYKEKYRVVGKLARAADN